MKPTLVLASLMAAALCASAHAEGKIRMYKCVDGTGKVYYSDKMNPDCGQSSEMNRQGVVMKKETPKSAGASAQQPAQANAPTAPRNAQDQERRDRALMATYTSEEEIDAARDRSLAIPAQGIKTSEGKLEKSNQRLTELKKQADGLAAQKKTLPPVLLEEVGSTQKEIAALEADLVQRNKQSEAIRAKYESDKARFRELKGVSTQATK
ncbi:MAG TPA: DUF4124 domain-containing protein [Burkholderiales bacterium]|nr:DUF4124 domain-containing protein [Burkholderiales bacterium]